MAEGRLIPHHDEAIVLRSWPFHEADLLVSLFTREQGKVKGIARHAMKSRRRFGGALEPGTQVRAHYTERPHEDLVRLDSFEILWSPLSAPVDALRLAGLQLVVEVLDEAMPDLAAEDNVFRLALATLTAMEDGSKVWLPVTYFCLWMNRLMGWMPELGHCAVCGLDLRAEPVWWSPAADGVTCADDRRPQSRALSAESVAESYRMARSSLAQMLTEEEWPRERAADLRAFALGALERHLERRLKSAAELG
ncbi:MAG TPA: DNA repair protein RecO [Acidobacteriaceae bacterium]